MRSVYLKTLGGLHLEGSALTRPKPLSLLAYLAFEGLKPRGHVRELFWGSAVNASTSLRMALKNLRTAGVLLEKADFLGCAVPSDVAALLEALDANDDQKAVGLYSGAFLNGLDLELPDFEEWLLTTSEYLATRVSLAYLRLAEAALESNDLIIAAREAKAAYSVEGNTSLEPDVLLRVLRVLELCDSDFALLVRREALELGLSIPNFKTQAKVSSLPVPLHRFVERAEQTVLLEYLQDNRLITIVGYGGAGKSRLALEVARAVQTSSEVFFVPLEAVMDTSGVAVACLRAIGETEIKPDSLGQLKQRINQTKTLLVLDNFEHLLEFAPQLLELLKTCPALQILITSRERLNVLGETVLPLSGFLSDAVALEFLSACALRCGIQLEPQNPTALKICNLLERYPLALELAAALTPVLPLTDIASALQEHLDILSATPQRNGRHNGMRAVFNWSWSLLTNPQRIALARLAVFKDGFARTAALTITDSNLTMLIALLQKSLVQNQHNGRYRLHPLIAQYCLEALEAIPLETAKAKSHHANYFLDWLENNAADVRSDKAGNVLSAFETDLENCKSAWLWLCENPDAARFERLQDMVLLFDARARFTEGIQLFEAAIEALEPKMALAQSAGSSDETLLRGMAVLHINAAWLNTRISQSVAVLEHATRANNFLEFADAPILNLKTLTVLGNVSRDLGQFHKALEYFQQSLTMARQVNAEYRIALALFNIGNSLLDIGAYDSALTYFQEANFLFLSQQDTISANATMISVIHLCLFCLNKDPKEIQDVLINEISKAEQQQLLAQILLLKIYLIFVYVILGNFLQAEQVKNSISNIKMNNQSNMMYLIAIALIDAGFNRLKEAEYQLINVAKTCHANNVPHFVHQALFHYVQITFQQNNFFKSAKALNYLLNQQNLDKWIEEKAQVFAQHSGIQSLMSNKDLELSLTWLN